MSTVAPTLFAPASEGPWLFGRRTDLLAFGGSAAAAFALLGVGAALGILEAPLPEPLWIACVLGVDVAHVWTTGFRVYFDPAEVKRRPLLYLGAPCVLFVVLAALHAFGPLVFWRALAYAAVFHFVRQQAGFVRLYQRREPGLSAWDARLDRLAIYTATLFPLAYWHAHLPRAFAWFVDGDFVAIPSAAVLDALAPLYHLVLVAFLGRCAWRAHRGARFPSGKVLLVTTTWLAWWVGIVALDGDYAFTVTNVLLHGVPYMALTYRYARVRGARPDAPRFFGRVLARGALGFLGVALALAFAEELLWDRLVWHERGLLFGTGLALPDAALDLVVPLLTLPQATHYLLDGFVWRARENPALGLGAGGDAISDGGGPPLRGSGPRPSPDRARAPS